MSKYTTEVRFICESACNLDESVGLDKVNEVIAQARGSIFENYPIFDEAYRATLETKILRHYYTREICAETPALWKLWLNNRMNEIMPYYNQLYKSALLEFNPLYDVDLYREHEGSGTTDSTGSKTNTGTRNGTESTTTTDNGSVLRNNNTTSDNWDLFQDTPQGGLTGIEELEYLTEATKRTVNGNIVDSTTTQNTNGVSGTVSETDNLSGRTDETMSASESTTNEINSTDSYLEHVYGKQGSGNYSKMLMEYRQTFINIDTKIIDDLKDLFFNLW